MNPSITASVLSAIGQTLDQAVDFEARFEDLAKRIYIATLTDRGDRSACAKQAIAAAHAFFQAYEAEGPLEKRSPKENAEEIRRECIRLLLLHDTNVFGKEIFGKTAFVACPEFDDLSCEDQCAALAEFVVLMQKSAAEMDAIRVKFLAGDKEEK